MGDGQTRKVLNPQPLTHRVYLEEHPAAIWLYDEVERPKLETQTCHESGYCRTDIRRWVYCTVRRVWKVITPPVYGGSRGLLGVNSTNEMLNSDNGISHLKVFLNVLLDSDWIPEPRPTERACFLLGRKMAVQRPTDDL